MSALSRAYLLFARGHLGWGGLAAFLGARAEGWDRRATGDRRGCLLRGAGMKGLAILAVGALLAAGCTAERESAEQTSVPAFVVLPDEVDDMPLKVQVVRKLVLSGPTTREQIETLVGVQYEAIRDLTGFRNRSTPSHIGIYVYASEGNAKAPQPAWLAMLWTVDADGPTPGVTVDEDRLAVAWAPPEERSGLSEEKRIEISQAVVRAERRARVEAQRLNPNDLNAEATAAQQLRTRYREEVASQYGITMDVLHAIIGESVTKAWPLPPD
jgi:hypothetical protein